MQKYGEVVGSVQSGAAMAAPGAAIAGGVLVCRWESLKGNNMTQEEILEFINQNMSCTLATCVDNKPYVRGMWMYKADGKGIIFHTGVMRDLYKQLQTNPNIELCFHNADPQNLMQVRVGGIAVFENDPELREEIISQRPFLKPIAAKYGQESIAVFRVKEMVASVWSMAKNLEPKEYISIR